MKQMASNNIKKEYSIEVVSSWDLTEQQKNCWDLLSESHSNPSIFLTLDWLELWWKIFSQKNDRLHIVFISVSNHIVGICPFYFQNRTTLRFIGTGEPESCEVCSEYLDLLVDENYKVLIVGAVYQLLLTLVSSAKVIILNNLLSDSYILSVTEQLRKKCFVKKQQTGVRYSIFLPKNYQIYTESLSKKFVAQINRKERKLNKLEGKLIRVNTQKELKVFFDCLRALHEVRWGKKGLPGAFSDVLFIDFHEKFTKILLEKEQLSMQALKVNDKIIGVIYNIKYAGSRFFYQIGIDVDYPVNLSLGSQLHLAEIRTAIEQNEHIYDFMKGTVSNSYKENFTNQSVGMFDVSLLERNIMNGFNMSKLLYKNILMKLIRGLGKRGR